MPWIKRLGVLIVALIALLIALIGYIVIFVDPNEFKQELEQAAADQANIQLRLDGNIHWSFFPWLGLTLEDIGVALPSTPDGQELLSFGRAEFGLAIMPLLNRKIQVDRVKLIDLNARLNVDAEGNPNWLPPPRSTPDNVSASPETAMSAMAPQAEQGKASPEQLSLPDLQLDELLIENAHIRFRDAVADQQIEARLNVRLADVAWDKAWPLTADVDLLHSTLSGSESTHLKAKLSSTLTVFPVRQAVSLENLVLSTDIQSPLIPVSPLSAELHISGLEADLPQENITLDGLRLSSKGLQIDSEIQAFQILTDPRFTANIKLEHFSPRQLLDELSIPLPAMADETTLQSASLDVALEGDLHNIAVSKMQLLLDDSSVTASADVRLAPLSWDLQIKGENLDLDRYLPPPVETSAVDDNATASTANSTEDTPQSTPLFPVETLQTLNGEVRFEWQNLTAKKLKIEEIKLVSSQENGLIRIAPLQANLYEGYVALDATLDARKDNPEVTINPAIDNLQILPLLKDFMDLDLISGATQADGELTTNGNSVDELMANLNGDLLIELENGALIGTNLTRTVCEGIAATRSASLNDSRWGQDTPFEQMRFPAHIQQGVASTPGMRISAAGLTVSGNGEVSLPAQSLDYRVQVGLSGSTLDSACRVKQKFAELAFPVQCKGKFSDDPAGLCRPDLAGFGQLFADLAKAELEAEKARLKAKLDAEKRALEAKLAKEKAEAEAKLKAEEARLQAELEAKKAELEAKKAKLEAEKARLAAELEAKKKAEEERLAAELNAKLEAEKARLSAELEAKKKAEEEARKKELEEKVKDKLKELF